MRKLLSLIISLIILFMSVADGVVAFAGEPDDNGLNTFAENLIDMIRAYDEPLDVNSDTSASVVQFYSSETLDESIYSNIPSNAFETKRLIVKSSKKIDYYGASDCVSGYNDLYILQYDTEALAKNAYKYYLECDYIEYVEPDLIVSAQVEVDEYIGEITDDIATEFDEVMAEAIEWLSSKIGFSDIKDELAEQIEDDYVLVAVLDSGVDFDHEFLEGRLVENNINLSTSGASDSCEDDYGHGTHVAGIIANNTLSNVYIEPYKVLNREGTGSLSTIALAVDMAVADGADIINMSLSANGESKRMTEAVDNAVANDVNVVVAAGNSSTDLDDKYISPASIESAITVSATDKYNNLASFSNYDGTIDIAAPGVDIESSYLNNSYISLSGTSMAAPQVVAGLAIIQTVFKDKPAIECEEMIKEYATVVFENEGENHFGAGILCLKYLLDGKPKTSDPVFNVDSCTFANSFTLTITCPDENSTILYVINDEENFNFNLLTAEKYTSSIRVSLDTTIYAIAVSDGKSISNVVKKEYIRANETEADLYDISRTGYIEAYFGEETDLVIPNKIQNITVKGIYSGAFKGNDKIHSVTLPSTATRIFNEAFMNCTALETVSGSGITQVEKNAFSNSSLKNFPFEQLTSVAANAFENCQNLQNVNLPKATTVGASAFKNAKGFSKLNCESLTSIGSYAFSGTDVEEVSVPNITSLGTYIFYGCDNLTKASLPNVKSITTSTFRDCVNLIEFDFTNIESVGTNGFRNTGFDVVYCENLKTISNYAFSECQNLSIVILPKATSVGANAFYKCPELQVVRLESLTTLSNNSFLNCPKLLHLWLPSVKTVKSGSLESTNIQYLRFDNVETIGSLPINLQGIVVPSTLSSITASVPLTDFVVYGYTGTYAEEFAINSNKEFQAVPAITYDMVDEVNTEDKFIVAYALGYNCTYQWYKNDELSNESGTPIEGAVYCYYEPNRKDHAEAYYCVITSDDGINSNTITTKYIVNAPEYKDADYTEYYALYEEYQNIDRDLYKEGALDTVDALFNFDIQQFSLAEQDLLNDYVEEIRKALDSAELKYLLCDINNDGKISVIDARLALKAVVGSISLDKTQTLAADVNGDGKISIADSRAILKSVLEQ